MCIFMSINTFSHPPRYAITFSFNNDTMDEILEIWSFVSYISSALPAVQIDENEIKRQIFTTFKID